MADIVIKQGDSRPAFVITLTEGSPASAINLTTATSAQFQMRPTAGGSVISPSTAITSAALGQITVTLSAANTGTTGDYQAEVQITWNDGGIQTIPSDTYLTVSIVDDIA